MYLYGAGVYFVHARPMLLAQYGVRQREQPLTPATNRRVRKAHTDGVGEDSLRLWGRSEPCQTGICKPRS